MAMRVSVIALFTALTLLLAVGCQKKEQSALEGLQGSWVSSCEQGQNFALAAYADLGVTQSSRIEVSDKNIKETSTISSLACDGRDIEITTAGRIDMNESRKDGDLSITPNLYQITPVTEFGVRVLNLSQWCGRNTWAIGEMQDVSAQAGNPKCFPLKTTTVGYSIGDGQVSIDNQKVVAASVRPLERTTQFTLRR